MRDLLADDGLVIFEVPYLREFSIASSTTPSTTSTSATSRVTALLATRGAGAGLASIRVDRVPVHGGSIRVYAGHAARHGGHAADVLALAAEERRLGHTSLGALSAVRPGRGREPDASSSGSLEPAARARGTQLAGYGAPAKGNTLLNYCGIGPDLLPYTVDKNPLKVGLYTPGMHIPVLPAPTLLERRPDYVLILAWNFADEIIAQQAAVPRRGRPLHPAPPRAAGGLTMQVVILAGGQGTRLAEETTPAPEADGRDRRPADALAHHEPLRPPRPQRLPVACGYKSEIIKEYFHDFIVYHSDYVIDLQDRRDRLPHAPRAALESRGGRHRPGDDDRGPRSSGSSP